MPPQRPLRLEEGAANSELPSRRVWNVVELRINIMRCLAPPDLAAMMRVERYGMGLVAQELYGVISHELASKTWFKGTFLIGLSVPDGQERAEMYRAAVREIHSVYPLYPDEALYMRKRHPNLRTIRRMFQRALRSSWTIHHFDSGRTDEAHGAQLQPQYPEDCGAQHATLHRIAHFPLGSMPPSQPLGSIVTYADGRTAARFFTLILAETGASQSASWLTAIRSNAIGDTYRTVRLGCLPITLGDLTNIYVRQAGRPASSSAISSASLRSLPAGRDRYVEGAVGMSFEDFIALIPCIRLDLPNLEEFHIALKGIETAEAFCGTLTSHGHLSARGKVTSLRIITADHDPPLFNVIRSVTPLLAGKTRRCWLSEPNGVCGDRQRKANSQSEMRRKYLEEADFASLGVVEPEDLMSLAYDNAGRPIPLRKGGSRTARQRKQTQRVGE
ncbi:uncharacterized protein MKK02DRAFT_34162 [Dioszegia hungarica]|uniref:Uncharacterized protein n=1 Tax=Dioszegia hungarica TaxID=4972 RepID=A0AA38HB54_9TREE|nr:uncharacterized protein MKK02DRAFT_34162 [Dioszegia hungarica]KAI9637128.1 hypothetical protein MKK02DRAFT_34162 [Dioszegia hungarica]